MELTLFKQALPAHLQNADTSINDEAADGIHVFEGLPALSARSKKWSAVIDDKRQTFLNAENEPASYVHVALVDVRKATSKRWYSSAWDPEADAEAPACFSIDGRSPNSGSEQPQHQSCQLCPKNEFGSHANGKGKACADYRRIVVVPVNGAYNSDEAYEPTELMMDGDKAVAFRFDISATALKGFGKYMKELTRHNVPYTGVVTKMRFDPQADFPTVQFDAVGLLTEDLHDQIMEARQRDDVQQEVEGASEVSEQAQAPAEPEPTDPEPEPEPAPKPKKKAKKKAEPKPEPEEEERTEDPAPKADVDSELDDLGIEFD
jgi:cell division septation protein DedD